MTEPTLLRLRAGGSVVLPADSTEEDIDNAGRIDASADDSIEQPQTQAAKPNIQEQP